MKENVFYEWLQHNESGEAAGLAWLPVTEHAHYSPVTPTEHAHNFIGQTQPVLRRDIVNRDEWMYTRSKDKRKIPHVI